MNETMWTLEQGLDFVRNLEPELAAIGTHCGLTGSVLYKGASVKDLDVIVYPHAAGGPDSPSLDVVWDVLLKVCDAKQSNICGGASQTRDTKEVRWLNTQGKRVDFFFLQ